MKIHLLLTHLSVRNILKFIFIGVLFTSFLLVIDENGQGYKTFFNWGNLLFLIIITSIFSLISIFLYPIIQIKIKENLAIFITFIISYTLSIQLWIWMIS
jgi:hypothetical protein